MIEKNRFGQQIRFGLSTFLLAVAAISVWIPVYQSRLKGREIRQNLSNLKLAARDLFIIEENQFAASKKHVFDNEHYWRVYLPDATGAQYQLRVANDDIPSTRLRGVSAQTPLTKTELPNSIVSELELLPGRHEIGLIIPYPDIESRLQRDSLTRVQLLVDGVEMASVSVPNSITVMFGNWHADVSHSVQQATTEPLVLTRNTDRRSSAERGQGFMMWIEQVDPGNTQ